MKFRDAKIADVVHGAVYICESFCFSELKGLPEFKEPRHLDDVLLRPAFGESLFIIGRDGEKIWLKGCVRGHITEWVFVRAKIDKSGKKLILEPMGMKAPYGWRPTPKVEPKSRELLVEACAKIPELRIRDFKFEEGNERHRHIQERVLPMLHPDDLAVIATITDAEVEAFAEKVVEKEFEDEYPAGV